ncbi:hypothetical protein BHY07_05515 [Bacillus subtilis subsp. subtilis]|mgnify:FL=1|uniref:UPF0754 membrane protein YheB n=3 Tax=Bacillus subtilis subsp. subtilis TaxID=135461 RepID=YHEB_BACSU|nr:MULTISPECIES: DUF445 domain-containing protein [Bacillales]NP_388860.1 conserved hypothetical protein [Bacillus subtilis subsp. subtilis str. 168]O07543.1 RecName: Full=UPF0754 membrane protein YheB [Bacillus subtilis subsp. subtilis str. 168]BAM49897.1 hypothetical protein BEST7613_0966 [Bacillus subtilis BEST7613]AFQ56894.1 YheB [Bacillus subtilis QB928]AGG60331.1 YheB [Bacillus subtilis subsp. subtilis 6051-HGW]AHA76944.1 UPF0754 membrane protein yheB [Bacillus subtilis PY79]AIC39363.1
MGIAGTFIFMIVIGAAIGAVTNHLAIQMLFRPYKAYYLFGKRVPFTPGLIPRRRDELAKQMGLMVVNHLLTPEGIKKRLVSDAAKTQALRVGEQLIQKLSLSEVTVKEALEKAGMKRPEKAADAWISSWTDDKLHELFRQYGDQSLKELVPIEVQEKLEEKIPMISGYILSRSVRYFESDEGKIRLGNMIDDFLKERGMLGSMVQLFLGNSSLADRVLPELLKFLRNEETNKLLSDLLKNEWGKLREYTFNEADEKWNAKALIFSLKRRVLQAFSTAPFFNNTIGTLTVRYESELTQQMLPALLDKLLEGISSNLESVLKRLRLEEIVKEQVDQFPVERLEEMVLSISKKEFKMITYLGGLLGGIIGAIQALFVILF